MFEHVGVVDVPVFSSSDNHATRDILVAVVSKEIEKIQGVGVESLDQMDGSNGGFVEVLLELVLSCLKLD